MEQRIAFGSIYLRKANPTDLQFLQFLYTIEDISSFCGSSNNEKLCVDLVNGNAGSAFIIENGLGYPVGYIAIFAAPIIKRFCKANWLQYAVQPMYRNCGYATQAVTAIVDVIKGELPIALLINDNNHPSIKVAQKCGFSQMELFDAVKPTGERINNEHCWLME